LVNEVIDIYGTEKKWKKLLFVFTDSNGNTGTAFVAGDNLPEPLESETFYVTSPIDNPVKVEIYVVLERDGVEYISHMLDSIDIT